jgi:hypothetical protein
MELLLTVDGHFLIKDRGILVLPWLDYPENRRFKAFSDEVVIRRPNGIEEHCLVSFVSEHVRFSHGGSNMHIILQFPEGTQETVPVGSQVFVSDSTWQKLHGGVSGKLDGADF